MLRGLPGDDFLRGSQFNTGQVETPHRDCCPPQNLRTASSPGTMMIVHAYSCLQNGGGNELGGAVADGSPMSTLACAILEAPSTLGAGFRGKPSSTRASRDTPTRTGPCRSAAARPFPGPILSPAWQRPPGLSRTISCSRLARAPLCGGGVCRPCRRSLHCRTGAGTYREGAGAAAGAMPKRRRPLRRRLERLARRRHST